MRNIDEHTKIPLYIFISFVSFFALAAYNVLSNRVTKVEVEQKSITNIEKDVAVIKNDIKYIKEKL